MTKATSLCKGLCVQGSCDQLTLERPGHGHGSCFHAFIGVLQRKSRRRHSSDEESEFESEEDEDEEEGDGWAGMAAASEVARPRRQAAQKANASIKVGYASSFLHLW